MGEKGAKQSAESAEAAAGLVADLASLGPVTSKRMFGGHGIFCEGVMFGLIDSSGTVHLRADETTSPEYGRLGGSKHGRMPYWKVPDEILASDTHLTAWASTALEVARSAKA